MMYDDKLVFVNGESYIAKGRDALLIRRLADQRMLSSRDINRLSSAARQLLKQWLDSGWIQSI